MEEEQGEAQAAKESAQDDVETADSGGLTFTPAEDTSQNLRFLVQIPGS
jgi:hypothetical protein